MPAKADYWKYFSVQGMLAVCQILGSSKPNVSLGALPKAGEKKRISKYLWLWCIPLCDCHFSVTGAVTNHLQKNHKPEWDAYCETRTKANAKKAVAKEEEKVACEMENNEVRFYDVRSSKGRLPFLKKVGLPDIFLISMMFLVQILPDVAEPPTYWLETDPRAEAGHFRLWWWCSASPLPTQRRNLSLMIWKMSLKVYHGFMNTIDHVWY